MRNGTPFTVEKIFPRAGLEHGAARSVGQRLTHLATGLIIVINKNMSWLG